MVLSDLIAVMRAGELQQLGPPMTVFRDPTNLFVASFIGSPAMNVLEATLEAAGNALSCRVAGQALRLPAGAVREATLAGIGSGRRVLFGIRPTDVVVQGAGVGQLLGQVSLVEPVGPLAYVDLEVGGVAVKATADPDLALAIGDQVALTIAPGRVYLFDPETEKRL